MHDRYATRTVVDVQLLLMQTHVHNEPMPMRHWMVALLILVAEIQVGIKTVMDLETFVRHREQLATDRWLQTD